ncbi:cupin domain-containing protein [uncultured Roseibium sp.]|uniref:cupin domain-containing protein n=1 Tax=uncultured Roseibium sp. TaxID=1936171 RepID=UPI0032176F6E
MIEMPPMLNLQDLAGYANSLNGPADWKPFHEGVTAHWFYDDGNGGAASVLLRYEAGARVPLHEHLGHEHIYLIRGDQYDEHGTYPEGSFVINRPGTRHSPGSKNGCIALLIYEKAVRFVGAE